MSFDGTASFFSAESPRRSPVGLETEDFCLRPSSADRSLRLCASPQKGDRSRVALLPR